MNDPEMDESAGQLKALSFGNAGVLYVGTDAEVIQGCKAVLGIYDRFWARLGPLRPGEYEETCRLIEARIETIAAISALSMAGVKAKAAAVERLSRVGMACGAARILATSLAADVLSLSG